MERRQGLRLRAMELLKGRKPAVPEQQKMRGDFPLKSIAFEAPVSPPAASMQGLLEQLQAGYPEATL